MVPKTRILRTIINGCKRLHFGGWPTRRQMMLMVRWRSETAACLQRLTEIYGFPDLKTLGNMVLLLT